MADLEFVIIFAGNLINLLFLPKTRSGKIMRRILKKILAKEENLGDTSTLVNPEAIEQLKNLK